MHEKFIDRFKKILFEDLEKKRYLKSVEFVDHKIFPFMNWFIFYKECDTKLHFINKDTLSIMLTILLPYKIEGFQTDELIRSDLYLLLKMKDK